MQGHRYCCPVESKAGAGAVSLALFALFVSLGCAVAGGTFMEEDRM